MRAEQLSLFRLPPAPSPAVSRPIVLGGEAIAYRLRVGGARRRLSLRIDERGLQIGAPRGVSLSAIEDFIREHGDWVRRKLRELTQTVAPRQLAVRDGSQLPYLGETIEVRVLPGANRTRWLGRQLVLEARADADLNSLAQRALMKQALGHFSARCDHFAPLLAVSPPALALSSARTRWGSCSSRSGVRINWRLIHLPPLLGDYVMAHELAHLHEMNHGPRFWAWVETVCPEWRAARAELRLAAARIPLL